MLNHGQTFNSVKGALAFDWLARYPAMPWYSLETLFGIAATHGDRAQLNALIEARCNDPVASGVASSGFSVTSFSFCRRPVVVGPHSVLIRRQFFKSSNMRGDLPATTWWAGRNSMRNRYIAFLTHSPQLGRKSRCRTVGVAATRRKDCVLSRNFGSATRPLPFARYIFGALVSPQPR